MSLYYRCYRDWIFSPREWEEIFLPFNLSFAFKNYWIYWRSEKTHQIESTFFSFSLFGGKFIEKSFIKICTQRNVEKKRKKENRSNQSLLRIYLLRRGRVYVYQMKIKSKVEDKPCPGVGGRGGGEEEGVGIELYRRVAIESRFRVSWPRWVFAGPFRVWNADSSSF